MPAPLAVATASPLAGTPSPLLRSSYRKPAGEEPHTAVAPSAKFRLPSAIVLPSRYTAAAMLSQADTLQAR